MSAPQTAADTGAGAEADAAPAPAPGIAAGPVPPDLVPPDDDPRWRRTHPASPWLANLVSLGAVVLFAPRPLASIVRDGADPAAMLHSAPVRWIAAACVAWLVLSTVSGVLAWRRHLFVVTDRAIHVRSGRFHRTATTVPFDRVQSVDVVLPLVGRAFGLAKIQVEVAGDVGSAVELRLLRVPEAHELRARLLCTEARHAAIQPGPLSPGRSPDEGATHDNDTHNNDTHGDGGADAGPAPAVVAVIPPERARRAVLRSLPVWGAMAAVLGSVAMLVVGIVHHEPGAWASGLFTLGGGAVVLGKAVFGVLERSSGFEVVRDGDALRVHHGLAEKHHRAIAPRRVQSVTLTQPLWWRAPGWWSVTVAVPGLDDTSADETKAAASDLFPIATDHEALRLIALALPGVPVSDTVAATMAGEGIAERGFIASPRRARIFAPLGWQHQGVLVTPEALVVRRGRWHRQVTVLGHQHPQVLTVKQGWWARRRDLATLTLAPAGRTLTVSNLDAGQARALWAAQVARAS